MFEDAIEKVSASMRPVHTIMRKYKDQTIIPSSATLLFINDEGCAITTRSFADMLIASSQMEKKYARFREEKNALKRDWHYEGKMKNLEAAYGYQPETPVQIRSVFIDCVDSLSGYTCHKHPQYDLAILKFNDFKERKYQNHAILAKYGNSVRQGKFLCRLGYPFPEFSNFQFNQETDSIEWTGSGKMNSPRFPMEGMLTRFLADQSGKYGIELSTPCANPRGGGPLFDERGLIYGLQMANRHMPQQDLHLGICLHVDIIKKFLDYHNIKYYTA